MNFEELKHRVESMAGKDSRLVTALNDRQSAIEADPHLDAHADELLSLIHGEENRIGPKLK